MKKEENEGETVFLWLTVMAILLVLAVAVLFWLSVVASPDYQKSEIVKTFLENDVIWVKGNCSFDIEKISTNSLEIENIFSYSTPIQNIHCEIYELKIGKEK